MKYLRKTIWLLISMFFLAGCVEINETIDISKNGSGKLAVDMNMAQLLDIIQQYAGKDEIQKQFPNKKMDTVIYMKNLLDSAKELTEDKKELLRDGNLHMKLDIEQKEFKMNMLFPFKSLDNLQKLYNGISDGSLETDKLFKGLSGNANKMPDSSSSSQGFGQFNAIYDFTVKKGLITRKLNPVKWKTLQQNPQLDQFKQSAGMGMEVPYTLTINLPSEVKKVDNPLLKISTDKKTVTLKYNLMDIFESPQKFEYTIEY